MPRVAIVAASAARREALRARAAGPGIEIVAIGDSIEDAARARPDVLLVAGPDLFVRALDWAAEDEQVAVVGLVPDRGTLEAARAAAADVRADAAVVRGWGLLTDTAGSREIAAAVGAADAGLASWPAHWTPAADERDARITYAVDDEPFGSESLTPREQDVLELLSLGLSNRRIAERLGISGHTVKFHVAAIYGKLGVSGRTAAVNRALRRGILKI
jgi:DNA-binding NarL/FixJ family response regulator